MGEFVRKILDERHINLNSLGEAMGKSGQAVGKNLNSKSIGEEILVKMSEALKFDLLGMVRDEQARLSEPAPSSAEVVAESAAPYTRRYSGKNAIPGANGGSGFDLTIRMDEYDSDVQLQILRFLQQQPRRGERAPSIKFGS